MQQGSLKLAFSRKQAASELSVSPRTIDYWISQGHLKARKLGKRVVIPGSELLRVLEKGIPSGVDKRW
jgi:excisionase family DNA binding protein